MSIEENRKIKDSSVLVTGGAGFIGSNLVEVLLRQNNKVIVLDNLSTGKRSNIEEFIVHPDFTFVEGDIRKIRDCQSAVKGIDIVLHQAALGSVPRSIKDPVTTNEVNISGFVNMLTAAKDEGIKRFVYAASSSTYGDHPDLPKQEDKIGKPLSPYAVTKYVNELYADVYSRTYGIECIGLRYFNVFGRRQDPQGAYAAVIPKFVKALIQKDAPVINGDGTHSRDFTHIDNVIQINQLAATVNQPNAINQVYNVACGENTNLNQLFDVLRENLSHFDQEISAVEVKHGPERAGDIKHSLASIEKAQQLLGYQPTIGVQKGLEMTTEWYWKNYYTK